MKKGVFYKQAVYETNACIFAWAAFAGNLDNEPSPNNTKVEKLLPHYPADETV